MNKKIIAMLLSLTMVLLMLAACSNSSKKTASSAAPNTSADGATLTQQTFTYLDDSHPSFPYNKDWPIWNWIKEKTGVTLDVQVPSGKLPDALNLAVASGNKMPNLMYNTDKNLADKFGQQGAVVNILDYAAKDMPNFVNWMKKYPQDTQNMMSSDGKMYLTPNQGIGLTNRMNYLYRKDIFDKNNITVPKTWDELYTVLKKLKGIYPDSYPFAFRDGLSKILNISPAFNTGSDYYYDFDKKEWRYGPVEDNYKKIVEYLRKFVKEGLIPPDFLSIDTKQWQDIMSTNRAFVTIDYISRIDFFNQSLRAGNPDFNLAYMAPPAGWEGGPQKNAFTQFTNLGFMVASTAKNIDNIMKFIDFFYSDQAKQLLSWGKEGETYKVNSDGSKQFIAKYVDITDMRNKTGISAFGTYIWFDFAAHVSLFSPELKLANDTATKYDSLQQPIPAFTKDETDIISTTGQEIQKFRDENVAKFVLGSKSMDDWDQYVRDLNKLGVDKILKIYTAAYERTSKAAQK